MGISFVVGSVCLGWYMASMAFCQEGWGGVRSILPWLIGLALVLLLVFSAQTVQRVGLFAFSTILVLLSAGLWIWAAGSLHSGANLFWDFAALTAGLVLAGFVTHELIRRKKVQTDDAPEKKSHVEGLLMVLFAWLLLSAITIFRTTSLPVDPDRFTRLGPAASPVASHAERWDDLRIGLALSGGGYRAAVFHAGVLQALEDLGLRVDNLATVSGGSIVGAYYAVGGDPADFVESVAAGRFDLKRQLLVFHHAVPLVFPARVPGSDVELLPVADFDRLDVQRRLLRRMLFSKSTLGGGLSAEEPRLGQPHLMIAVTDLTYGFQIGLLPDGILKLGEGRSGWDAYRGDALQVEPELSLAERVAISGAFPVAFPPRSIRLKIDPIEATGRGWRDLLLVDGGVRDNLGYHLLLAAHSLADGQDPDPELAPYRMPAHWDLDAILVSDGGAALGVLEEPTGGPGVLGRLFDVANLEFVFPPAPDSACQLHLSHPPTFSPGRLLLRPDQQFNLKNDPPGRASVERKWSLHFDPALYPEPVLRRIMALLPGVPGEEARSTLDQYLREWGRHRTTGRPWARSVARARQSTACRGAEGLSPATPGDRPELLPGVCEALALRALLKEALDPDLEVFRSTSTLEDRLAPEVAAALERLGQVLVYLQWPALESRLDGALRCRSSNASSAHSSPPRSRLPPTADAGEARPN